MQRECKRFSTGLWKTSAIEKILKVLRPVAVSDTCGGSAMAVRHRLWGVCGLNRDGRHLALLRRRDAIARDIRVATGRAPAPRRPAAFGAKFRRSAAKQPPKAHPAWAAVRHVCDVATGSGCRNPRTSASAPLKRSYPRPKPSVRYLPRLHTTTPSPKPPFCTSSTRI